MLATQELNEVKRSVLRDLPRILEKDPQFIRFIEGILSEKFPRREEFNRLLEEVKQLRKDMDKRFEQMFKEMERRFELMRQDIDKRFEQMSKEMERRFELMRQDIDKRFEQMSKEMERRFELMRQEMNQRFEQVDQRFEQVDQRFEQIDQRFEQIDQRFEQVDQRMSKLEQSLSDVVQEMRTLRHWVELNVGRLQTRTGRNIEKAIAGAFRLGLQRSDIEPEDVKLRQIITDKDGLVFKAGKQKEVDLIAQNGELLVFEVKSAPDIYDVDDFADKVELVRLQNTDKKVQGVFVAIGCEEDIRRTCKQRDILLIP